MKKCPFCAEQILDEAIKCRYCGEFLNTPRSPAPGMSTNQSKWTQSTTAIIIGLLTIGPFALPLVWANPKWSKTVKTVVTFGVLGITVAIVVLFIVIMNSLYRQLTTMLH